VPSSGSSSMPAENAMVGKTKIRYIKSSVNDNYIIFLKMCLMAEYT
jgi:hypothetical protein